MRRQDQSAEDERSVRYLVDWYDYFSLIIETALSVYIIHRSAAVFSSGIAQEEIEPVTR